MLDGKSSSVGTSGGHWAWKTLVWTRWLKCWTLSRIQPPGWEMAGANWWYHGYLFKWIRWELPMRYPLGFVWKWGFFYKKWFNPLNNGVYRRENDDIIGLWGTMFSDTHDTALICDGDGCMSHSVCHRCFIENGLSRFIPFSIHAESIQISGGW